MNIEVGTYTLEYYRELWLKLIKDCDALRAQVAQLEGDLANAITYANKVAKLDAENQRFQSRLDESGNDLREMEAHYLNSKEENRHLQQRLANERFANVECEAQNKQLQAKVAQLMEVLRDHQG